MQTPERNHLIDSTGDVLINLSCLDEDDFVVSMVFENGEYTFDDLAVYEFSLDDLEQKAKLLGENHLKNLSLGKDMISGQIAVPRQELLYLSIPFQKGWKAFDNGNECEILRVNGNFSSILLEKGDHTILLTYETPGLKIGRLVSKIALAVLFIVLLILFIRMRISQRGFIARLWHRIKMMSLRKLVK